MSETWLTVEVIHTDARILRISGAAKSEQSGHHHHPKPAATCTTSGSITGFFCPWQLRGGRAMFTRTSILGHS